jgi:hypothetical protein
MKITVTQEDIDIAIARFEACPSVGICQNCPVAVAMQRFFPEFGTMPWTDGMHVGLYDMTGYRAYNLPEEVTLWVGRFDQAYAEHRVLDREELEGEEPAEYPAVPIEFEVDDNWVRWQQDLRENFPKELVSAE